MISFILCLLLLIAGYFTYGKIVDKTFGPDDRETPAVRINDGVDYVVMPQWKLFLVQLLNIAGLGPIFGALQGALWGPVVFLWITFGTIFAGGVHDYFSGMISERNDGASIAEVTGKYLGHAMQNVMRVFSVILLIMVGTVFAVGPAGLIVTLCKNNGVSGVLSTTLFWLIVILAYYFIATFISIDKIIGKVYPLFGMCLIIMAVGVIIGIFTNPAYTIPEIWTHMYNMHPSGTPIWSFMFITVACGAISGFHSTQSPLMARCMKNEKQGHFVFYGAMVAEGIIALIWAAAGCALYEVTGGLNTGLAEALAGGQSAAIYDVCSKTMGGVGIALAMIGVVVCPITSGDTAFRSARLTLSDWFHIDQSTYANRLKLCVPVLGIGAILGIGNATGLIDYTVIWRYFSWTNQTLAMIVLWAAAMFLFTEKKNCCRSGDLHECGLLHLLHSRAGVPRRSAERQDGRRRCDLQYRRSVPHRHCIRSNPARCVHSRDQKARHEEKRINDRIRCSRPFVLFDRLQSSAEVIEVTENDVQTLSARFRAHR